MKWIFSIVTAGVLFAGSANAKLMEFDLESEGDGLVTLDTNSGLMWLDLTVTGGKSISQVKAMLANGELEGWRLPVAQDVYDLALSTFSSLNDISTTYMYLNTDAEDIEQFALMGQNVGFYTYGQYEIDGEGTYLLGAFPNKVTINYQLDYYNGQDVNRDYDGVFLVSTNYDMAISVSDMENISGITDVPTPLAFASLALMGMLTSRRKQQ